METLQCEEADMSGSRIGAAHNVDVMSKQVKYTLLLIFFFQLHDVRRTLHGLRKTLSAADSF